MTTGPARYGILEGQRYIPADGSKNELLVVDTETYAHCDDVVVSDPQGRTYRIDAFKLARCRYCLKEN